MVLKDKKPISCSWISIKSKKNLYIYNTWLKLKLRGTDLFEEMALIRNDRLYNLGYKKSSMNACGYSLGTTFAPNWMDWPMLYTGNPVVLKEGMVFFIHMILMDSDNQLAMNLGETYLVTSSGNERLGKKKIDLVVG